MTNITPSMTDIELYLKVVFGYLEGFIPCRSFPEKGANTQRPPHNIWIHSDEHAADNLLTFANWADKEKVACYVIPGTVKQEGQASATDVVQMQTILVDLDTGNTKEKLALLTQHLCNPTLIVESGGITKEGHQKLHIYWQLSEVAEGNALKRLLQLRHHIARCIGGDCHFQSAHQPIRVAGSTYHKGGIHKLVTIRSHQEVEYHLEELIERAEALPNVASTKHLTDHFLGFNTAPLPIKEVLVKKVYEGGEGNETRFHHISRVIGYFIRRHWDGFISQEKAWEEIADYNMANVVPPMEKTWLKNEVTRLWKKHSKEYGKHRPLVPAKTTTPICSSFSLDHLLGDKSEMPKDLIAPRLLTPGGLLVFGGAPKVGKSDFLLSMFTHFAAGEPFLSFRPARPLRIFYFQSEIGYHYLRERLQQIQLPKKMIELAKDHLFVTPNTKLQLSEEGVNSIVAHIKENFQSMPDMIAIDPIRNVFDGGSPEATENSNKEMLFFLQNRIEPLRDRVNPDAGIVLVHHTKKIEHKKFKEDPFQAFSGASSLRSYYSSGMILHKPSPESHNRELVFELRNGPDIPDKVVTKSEDGWLEINTLNKRIVNQQHGLKLDAERDRRDILILNILADEARKGYAYSINSFCEAFDGKQGLGSKDSIFERIKVLTTKGYIKFFKNTRDYGLPACTSKYGAMCFEGMELMAAHGEVISVIPTHYKHHQLGSLLPVKDPTMWTIYDEEGLC